MIIAIVNKLINPLHLTDMFVLGMAGLFGLMIGSDVWRKNAKDTCYMNNNRGFIKPANIQNDETIIGGN
jgi:hypothetical protein